MTGSIPPIFGPIMQISYLVRDVDAAMDHWAKVMGVGPFFVLDHVEYEDFFYRDQVSDVDMAVAIAYAGDMQIELVQQHNEAPSIFQDFLTTSGEGMMHLGATTDNLEQDIEKLAAIDIKPVQWGKASNGTLFAYVATDFHPGAMIELVEISPRLEKGFQAMKRAAEKWDGKTVIAHRS